MTNASQSESFTEQVGSAIFVTFMAFVSVAGALTNFVVILSIFLDQNLRTRTNYVVFSLAVSDFFVATVAIPLRLLEELNTSKNTTVPCNVVLALTIVFDGVSRLNIVLISIDRFVGVRFPFSYAKYTSRKIVLIAIAVCWTTMWTFSICILSGVGLRSKDGENVEEFSTEKSKICLLSSTLSEAAVMTFTIGFCTVPMLVVAPINFYLVKKSHWHMKKIQDLHRGVEANFNSYGSDFNARKQRQELALRQGKRAKMVAVLVCLFLVFVAPITIIDVIETLGSKSVPSYLSKSAVCLIYLNTVVNMFVYAAFNREFRDAFLRIFTTCRKQFSRLKIGENRR